MSGHPIGGPVISSEKPERWAEPMRQAATNDLFVAHARNFVDCMKSRQKPNADVEDGHRRAVACHLANISLRLGGRALRWDPEREKIVGDREASAYLVREYRKPWDEVIRLTKS
jgi:hypothetical protein